MTEQSIVTRIEDYVGVISLNRPSRHNAMTDESQALLLSAIQDFSDDPSVRAIVLRGEGKSFCSGRDTRVLGQRQPGDSDYTFVQRAQRIAHAILDCPKPIIAAVKGVAIGGGFEFALASDMRVIGHSAKMSLPEVIYGLLPDMGGTQTLTSLVGRARAKYLIMSGDSISAEQAHQWGIADWLVDDSDVDTQALAIAKKIAAQSPQSVMMAKRLVDQVEIADIKQGLQQELTSITTLFKSDDYAEARQALIDKRKPCYTGK